MSHASIDSAPVTFVSPIGINSDNQISGGNWTGDTYQGVPELVYFNYFGVNLQTDEDGTLTIEFSQDGVNFSEYPTEDFTISSGINEVHGGWKGSGRYIRILFKGTGGRSYFRLQTSYSQSPVTLTAPLNQNISSDQDATIVRAVLVGADSFGAYNNVHVSQGGALIIGDFFTEVGLGNVEGYDIGVKFGRNPDIDTASIPEDMWNGGGSYTGHPVSFTPETVDIYSSSGADSAAGTGARAIRLVGLETSASTEYTSEDIALNGASNVTSVNTWWRINRAYVLTAGSGEENAGTITIQSTTTTTNVFVQLPIGYNQTTIGAYTVPSGKTMEVKKIRMAITRSGGTPGSATITLRMREPGGVFRAVRVYELQTGSEVDHTALGGINVIAGSDVKFTIDAVSDNNTIAEAAFEYVLIDI